MNAFITVFVIVIGGGILIGALISMTQAVGEVRRLKRDRRKTVGPNRASFTTPDNFPPLQFSDAGIFLDNTDQVIQWGYARALEPYARNLFNWMAAVSPVRCANQKVGGYLYESWSNSNVWHGDAIFNWVNDKWMPANYILDGNRWVLLERMGGWTAPSTAHVTTATARVYAAPLQTHEPHYASGGFGPVGAVGPAGPTGVYQGAAYPYPAACYASQFADCTSRQTFDHKALEERKMVMEALEAPPGTLSTEDKRKALITAVGLGIISRNMMREMMKVQTEEIASAAKRPLK